jgi:hypothetical protein
LGATVPPRHRAPARALHAGLLTALLAGCGDDPGELIIGCWAETEWAYERADTSAVVSRWNDGIRVRQYPDRQVLRHEAEAWEFMPRGELAIRDLAGEVHLAKWRLKGRGHVLTIRHDDERFEVYDIKELTRDELALHYDMGMEVRGIARLEFERTSCVSSGPRRRETPDEDLTLATQSKSENES